MMDSDKLTYISLFSSAGVGCYGFKQANYDCIATLEIIERRLNVQKNNDKCKYPSGYICGDITKNETKKLLYDEIKFWYEKEKLKSVDVIIATPPCQGMSVANHKKNDTEIVRNSLVVESIKIINNVKPKFFVFENVPAFMKTLCTDIDGKDKPISEAIRENLGEDYSYFAKVINFKNYGSCSSRQRTIVIGVSNKYSQEVSPIELFPKYTSEKTLRMTIGSLASLNEIGEIDENDIYHFFRKYPEYMRSWIHDLKEGESAFDNEDDFKKPHQIIDGEVVINQRKNADKYTRQYWDKVGPCIHTRNDQLASQNTIHPKDDRVFSIREIMLMMTVPFEFKWSQYDLNQLNNFSNNEKQKYLKKEEINIRQCLGEAVPTTIFKQIAENIKHFLSYKVLSSAKITKLINEYKLDDADCLVKFITENPLKLSISSLSKIAELSNTSRTDSSAYYTSKPVITEMFKRICPINKKEINVLEPSVGVGNFIQLICKYFEDKEKVTLDLVDVDSNSIRVLKVFLKKLNLASKFEINIINDDFLTHKFEKRYDLVIGNPPFSKACSNKSILKLYKENAINKNTNNIASFFLDKSVKLGDLVFLVFPKFLLNTPEFESSRNYLECKEISSIIDFGEKWFPGVLIETIAIQINNNGNSKFVDVFSATNNIELLQNKKYIFDKKLPYWIIYRNNFFDSILSKLSLDEFYVFRDRQITNKFFEQGKEIRVLKSKNISQDGKEIINIAGYDSFINNDDAEKLEVYKYLNDETVYLAPNMTYYPRVIKKPKGVLVNGSVAILYLKDKSKKPTDKQIEFLCSKEFREFYRIARNFQTRSLNIDSISVKFFGLLRD